MKKAKATLTALCAFCITISTAQAQMPGIDDTRDSINNADAAVKYYEAFKAATKFLSLIYDVQEKSISYQGAQEQGEVLLLKAAIPGQLCALTMAKKPDANKFGWTIREHSCTKT